MKGIIRIVGITGPSNSGKTSLIEKVIPIFNQWGYRVGVVKHDPKDKAVFDIEGKDSWRFFQTGADVVVISPSRTTLFSHRQWSWKKIIALFPDADIVVVEGLREIELPRLGVFRKKFESDYRPFLKGVAVDKSVDKSTLTGLEVMDLNKPVEIARWLFNHALTISIGTENK